MRVEICVTKGPAEGQSFTFDKPDRFLFGRGVDARISLPDDPYVSRRHFLLEISPPECKVTDLESKNGTFVNDVRYGGRKPPRKGIKFAPDGQKEVRLHDGDVITVGDTRMRVSIAGAAAPPSENLEAVTRSQTPEGRHRNKATTNPLGLLSQLLKEAAAPKKHDSSIPSIPGYHLEQLIDRGGMGMIYKAIARDTRRIVAIKIMLPQMATDPENVNAFQREIDLTRQLTHPHIVQLLDHGKTRDSFYFVLEYVDGMNLYKFLESQGGSLSLEQAAPIIMGTLEGLAYAHQAKINMQIAGGPPTTFTGIVHRDLKPQNILLAHHGQQWFPKISDFGISKSFESAGFTNITKPGDVLGTPMYWPREQITHYKYLNPATDVFSIAAVFYELLTGKWVRKGFDALFDRFRQQKRPISISDYMNVIIKNASIPIQERNSNIPGPVARVLDRALQEAEVPYDEASMREALSELRYANAQAFYDAMLAAFKEIGLAEDCYTFEQEALSASSGSRESEVVASVLPQARKTFGHDQQFPQSEHNLSSNASLDGAFFYSIMQPSSSREVALLVLDLKESAAYLNEVGDTYFFHIMSGIYKRVRQHSSSSDLIFLKSTGDGFLAVFHTIPTAFSLAMAFLDRPVNKDVQLRLALHWGNVKTQPDGDVLGVEVHRVFRMESVRMQDQIDPLVHATHLPIANRLVITKQSLEQIPAEEQAKCRYAGKFLLKGFDELCELWVLP